MSVRIAHIDFETRSRVDLKSCGAYRYAEDESTTVLCLTWKYSDSDHLYTWFFKTPDRNLDKLVELSVFIDTGGIIKGHNVEFEYAVWNQCFREQIIKLFFAGYFMPLLKIEQLRCTAAEAATLTYPRKLADLCIALDTDKKKDLEGYTVMMRLAAPKKDGTWHEDMADFKTLISYNRDDVLAEEACDKKLLPLTPIELKIFHLTIRMNERGIHIDKELAANAQSFIPRLIVEKGAEMAQLTEGRITKGTQIPRIKKELKLFDMEVDCLDKDAIVELLKRRDLHPTVRKLLKLRQLTGKNSIAKYRVMLDAACRDGRVKGCLMYHGATTGRWAGRGMQPHNFPKLSKAEALEVPTVLKLIKFGDYELLKSIYPDVQTALSICLRSMLTAQKGNTYFDIDWNAIEARIILWLAGDQEGLDVYNEGRDPYIELAALVYGIPIKDVTDDQRQKCGKPGVLGGGFGMGWEKFAVKENLDPLLAHATIKNWRKLHTPVVKFWKTLINAAIEAVEHRGRVVKAGNFIRYMYDGQK